MQEVTLASKTIYGLSTRTKNSAEFDPKTAKIGALHQRFDANVTVNYKEGARVYAIYYDFESDSSGEYTILAGADTVASSRCDLEEVTIQAGKYLCFKGKGPVPKVIFETWQKVWDYFDDPEKEKMRAYTTDFEYYLNGEEIEIYISIR